MNITYKEVSSESNIEELFSIMETADKEVIGELSQEQYSFYAYENQLLVGAININFSWNWVTIIDVLFENDDV